MRRLAVAGVFLLAACSSQKSAGPPPTIEPAAETASVLATGDPRTAAQLGAGFHAVENDWRWVAHVFTVQLRPPMYALQRGATLRLRGTLPDAVVSRTGPVSLWAKIGETALPAQTFSKAGEVVYVQDVAPALLQSQPVKVEFTTDKFLKPGEVEQRELALIVSTIGLEAKK